MPPTRKTLLLADDHHILYRAGTRRVLHPAQRHPANPLVSPTLPWEVAIGWTSIWHDPTTGKYQLWYQAFADDRAQKRSHGCVVCYAESDDGIHFTKPELDLFSFNDVPRTNIVLIGSGGYSYRYSNSVVVDPADPDPGRRYKMAYYDFEKSGGAEYPGVCIAFSPDGIHWTKHDSLPRMRTTYGALGRDLPFTDEQADKPWDLALSMSDGVDTFFDPQREVFAIYGKMWIDGPDGNMCWKHGMGRTESRDFVDWSTPQLVCIPDDEDPPHVEFHTTPVFYRHGLYCCLNQILNRSQNHGVIDVELMLSRDGFEWQRPFRQKFFLPRNAPGAFDSGSLFTNSTPVFLDNEMRFYYGAYSQGATSADDRNHQSGVGLAVLPRDRFAGITSAAQSDLPTQRQPLEDTGQVTLKPLDLEACDRITLNANAGEGEIRAEILDGSGLRLRGFSRHEALPVSNDGLDLEIGWQDRRLSDLPPGPHMLRLHLHRSTVYAVDFHEKTATA
jgi:hypothetical protein